MTMANARLSRDLTGIGAHYDVIVVGSGYGASVMASRLARAGRRVCVLERGREIRPGQYPATLATASGEMQVDTSGGKLGSADGLFNLHINPDMLALVGCGLGGTSLINANVGLAMEPRLMEREHWPLAIRGKAADFGTYYDRARQMLAVTPYPETSPPLNKIRALEQSAKMLGKTFSRPPIAVNFEAQVNPQGVTQPACNNCGDCCSGCNVGAKNTLLMNYLPDAVNHGAEIFTRAHVSHVLQDGARWTVHYAPYGEDAPGNAGTVTADIVVVGAGALGSTEIMLRSRANGLSLSDRLGEAFSGNGDILAFGYDSYWQTTLAADGSPVGTAVNAIGVGRNTVRPDQYPGPCIAGVIDMRDAANPDDGLVIEEGVIPGAMAAAMPAAFFFGDAMTTNFMSFGIDEVKPRLLDAQALGTALQEAPTTLGAWAYKGPMSRTQTYLVMSVDSAAGKLVLDGDRVAIDWPGAGAAANVARCNDLVREASEAVKGQFLPNPLWTAPLGKKLITVHPVGGCGMGDAAETGVVDHKCRVFAGTRGDAVHAGLYVCDGSVMPGGVGVNPLLTISAVAERAAELMCADRGWTIDWARAVAKPLPKDTPPPADPSDPVEHGLIADAEGFLKKIVGHLEDGAIEVAEAALKALIAHDPDLLSPGFAFTETMSGHVSLYDVTHPGPKAQRVSDDYSVATAWGRAKGTSMRFRLTIATDSLNHMTTDAKHPGTITGTVTCDALGAEPMPVRNGSFSLLAVDETTAERWIMRYDMVLDRPAGPCRFRGYKILKERPGSDVWTDVTTLFVTVHDGDDGTGPLLAQGILTLGLDDLMWQSSSVTLTPPGNLLDDIIRRFPHAGTALSIVYLGKFAGFFALTLFRAYGGVLADLENFPASDAAAPTRPRRVLRLPASGTTTLDVGNGFRNRLTRYRGGTKGPVIIAPGFSIRASSFALDTIETSFAEALVAAGYDTWLFDYRASPDSGTAGTPDFTVDDIANHDWPAAIAEVRRATGAADVQVVAHCVASVALLMALASGQKGVRSAVSSQFTLHPVTDWLNYLKADLGAVEILSGLSQLHGAFDFTPGSSVEDKTLDFAAWNIPVPDGQACKNPACKRIFTVYGPSYNHARLNHWTHVTVAEQFGAVSIKPFEQLQTFVRVGHAVAADGRDCYVTLDGARNLQLPISFMSGTHSQIFYPETAQRTRQWLAQVNDPALYRHQMFAGYAHTDLFIGSEAATDFFPWIIAELDRFNPVDDEFPGFADRFKTANDADHADGRFDVSGPGRIGYR